MRFTLVALVINDEEYGKEFINILSKREELKILLPDIYKGDLKEQVYRLQKISEILCDSITIEENDIIRKVCIKNIANPK